MNGLQEAFYIIGIVFMSIALILLLALVAAVFVIRSKINKIHAMIEERINAVVALAEKGEALSAHATNAVISTAKKVLKKKYQN